MVCTLHRMFQEHISTCVKSKQSNDLPSEIKLEGKKGGGGAVLPWGKSV